MMRRYRLTVSGTTSQRQWLQQLHNICILIPFSVSLLVVVNLGLHSDSFVLSWQLLPMSDSRCRSHNFLLPKPSLGVAAPQRIAHRRSKSVEKSSTTVLLANKLWDRLQIEEDDEPMWYLLNCVATNEIDLLRQCRQVFAYMDEPSIKQDVIKFVVPIEKKTRSHGANKMVTETKVKYPGYVFAKLRLCPIVYETVQGLDLCRSWMGTVNHKGYKKLPPAPLALNEDEIENFGLEDIMEDIDDEESKASDQHLTDANGIIVDSSEDDENDTMGEEYNDPMYKNIDKKSLKQYKGLKVEDMVKVTQKGKFYNEDGIVRRLKDGQIFVRFYTYGTMFEEWIPPNDLRKLTPEEVLRGLSGTTQPITQKDFDQSMGVSDPRQQTPRNADRPLDLRDALRSSPAGGIGDRNRRQDRIADRFKSNNIARYEQRDADKNWNWYKEQQHQTKKQQDSVIGVDSEWTMRAGSNDGTNNGWVEGDVDSQWGRKPQRQMRREERRTSPTSDNYVKNRMTEAAIDGTADWSAFVTPSAPHKEEVAADTISGQSDAFFASLMSDLKKDLPVDSTPRDKGRTLPPPNNVRPRSIPPTIESRNKAANTDAADDFFSSLMSDLNKDIIGGPMTNQRRSGQGGSVPNISPASTSGGGGGTTSEDDFFASLMSDLTTSPTSSPPSLRDDSSVGTSKQTVRPTVVDKSNNYIIQQDDDFFASLEAELETSLQINKPSASTEIVSPSTTEIPVPSTKVNDSATTVPFAQAPSPSSDLDKNTMPVLKDMLRARGLKVSGTKAELIERLSNA